MHRRAVPMMMMACAAATACRTEPDPPDPVASWTVSPSPSVSIGAASGDTATLFQRIVGARITSTGEIVVGDAGLGVIRVFDSDGTFRVQMGRPGEGPGEFRSLRGLWIVPPDTIGAWDSGAYRLTFFRVDGSLVRSVGLRPSTESSGVGRLDQLVGPLSRDEVALASIGFGDVEGDRADRMSVELFRVTGEHIGRVGEVRGMVRGARAPVPYSPFPYFAVRGDAVYFTNGASPEVTVLEAGGVARTITLPRAEHDVNAAWEALRPALEEKAEPYYLSFLEEMSRPDSIPHIAGLLVDDAGRVWTKRYQVPWDALWIDGGERIRGGRWLVADLDGKPMATVDLPDGFTPLQVAEGRLLGLSVDALGVEGVEVYDLIRPDM